LPGHVHLAFGNEVVMDSGGVDAATATIDREIIHSYGLHPPTVWHCAN